ncbi:MAG TPA: sugar phosphate nucleotidyltransferase [Terriglobales bacterium]|nr:sugar phosphate nucleotidyltransferase [Terriglobales bacterium]
MQPKFPGNLGCQSGTLDWLMLGIVPAAGNATRMQPLGGSKELLPLGWNREGGLRVIAEYLIERMFLAGADRICLVISPHKHDLLAYFGHSRFGSRVFFVLQPEAAGLCDAVFRAAPHVESDEAVLIGLPDTVWHPRGAFDCVPRDTIHLITFPVPNPEEFDAVDPGAGNRVARVEVKRPGLASRRVWGAITAPGRAFLELEQFWQARGAVDQYLGHLFNAWISAGGTVTFDTQGKSYWDVGTPGGYRQALEARVWENESPWQVMVRQVPQGPAEATRLAE